MLLGVKLLRGTIIDDKDDHVEVDDANHHHIAGDSGATKHKAHAGMRSRGYCPKRVGSFGSSTRFLMRNE